MIPKTKCFGLWYKVDPEIHYEYLKSIILFEYWKKKRKEINNLKNYILNLPIINHIRDKISKRRFNKKR